MTKNELIKVLPLANGVELLNFNDKLGLFAINKPIGIKSHPNSNKPDSKAVLVAPYDVKGQFYKVMDLKIHVLHRIDSPTSGVLLLCYKDSVAKEVRQFFKDRKVEKTYHAVLKGKPNTHAKLWKDNLSKVSDGVHARVVSGGGLPAETLCEFITRTPSGKFSLVKLTPRTGRTHQIRIQCALRKHPILGDQTYGDFVLNKRIRDEFSQKRLFLHASAVKVPLRIPFEAHSPLPEEFNTL